MQSCNQAAVHGHFTVLEKVSWNFTLGTDNSIEHPDFPLKQNGSVIPETHFSRGWPKRIFDSIWYTENEASFIFQVWILEKKAYWTIQVNFRYPNTKEFSFHSAWHFFLPQFHEFFSLEWRESFSFSPPLTCGNSTPSSFSPASVAAHR